MLKEKDFLERAKIHHHNKYDYSKVVFKNMNDPITVVCPKHGEFEVTPKEHLRRSGCIDCMVESQRMSLETFLKYSKIKYGDKYDYSLIDKNIFRMNTVIDLICKEHGEFKVIPRNFLKGKMIGGVCGECFPEYIVSKMMNGDDDADFY